MSPVDIAVMALASYRLWRFIGRDSWPPSEWLRRNLHTLREDLTAGITGSGLEWDESIRRRRDRLDVAQELIECPWCLGAWIAAAVVAWTDLAIGLELPALQWLAVSTLVGLIGSID